MPVTRSSAQKAEPARAPEEIPSPERQGRRFSRLQSLRSLRPYLFSYLINPPALAVALILRHMGAIEQHSLAIYICTFVTIPVVVGTYEYFFQRHPGPLFLQLRIALHVAAVTVVIYLIGWGPVSIAAYTFIALEVIAENGSRAWLSTVIWSLVGISIGQFTVWKGWVPAELSVPKADTLGVTGSFLLVFVIYMAGVIAREKERAEALLRTNEERFRSLVLHSSDTILMVDDRGRITYASPAIESLLGMAPDEILGMRALSFLHPDDSLRVRRAIRNQAERAIPSEPVQFRLPHANGTWPHVEAFVSDFRDQPSVGGFVINLRDITERKEAEERLAYQAMHDALTGLSNRILVMERAEQMLSTARRTGMPMAALYVDLDDFKTINDDLGHGMGDELLILAAQRLRAVVRDPDCVGRVGGDEFVVLLNVAPNSNDPEQVARRLIQSLGSPYQLGGSNYTVTVSIGVAVASDRTVEELLHEADQALYQAKAAGKNVVVKFDPQTSVEIQERLDLKNDLRQAMANAELRLVFQPTLKLQDLSVFSIEALLRWDHPVHGQLMPLDFISLAEDTSTIVDVGRWVLLEACRAAVRWQRPGVELPVSVNLSGRQLRAPSLLTDIEEALDHSGLPVGLLILEITETVLMNNGKGIDARLRQLDDLGVRLAVDDFGTGHSALNYLRELPIDILKIDRSIVSAIGSSEQDSLIVHTLMTLGRALQLETTAEGIESEHQLAALRTEQCEAGQGFLFAEPLESEALDDFLEEWTAAEGQFAL